MGKLCQSCNWPWQYGYTNSMLYHMSDFFNSGWAKLFSLSTKRRILLVDADTKKGLMRKGRHQLGIRHYIKHHEHLQGAGDIVTAEGLSLQQLLQISPALGRYG